ncbi:MAG TPA: homoserine dehydrogenase, partial [Sporomusaceae bacterium]|nr:homoserine dehydrogenase [Sporomusaceae bacterium]
SSILVRNKDKQRAVDTGDAKITTDINEILANPDIDIIVEVMGGEQPAKEYILQALNAGKHVVTANKDVVAKYGRELFT